MYKSTTYLVLNDHKFPPSSTFTQKQLHEAGQSKENIEQLEKAGVLTKDMDAPIHKDHQPIVIKQPATQQTVHVIGNDAGAG